MLQAPHILLVDDDPEIRRLTGRFLESQGFRASLAANRRELLERLKVGRIDLVVLDIMLPDGNGLEICRELRASSPRLPILLLTALKEEVDRIIGLEIGADDYLGKPFNPRELVARIRAILRRRGTPDEAESTTVEKYVFAGFTAEPARRRLTSAEGAEVPLTGAEFDLLSVFLRRPGRVLSRDQLLDLTDARGLDRVDRSVDVLMSRLRSKLGDDGFAILKTVRNGGYQMTVPVQASGGD